MHVAELICGLDVRRDIHTLNLQLGLASAFPAEGKWYEWRNCEEGIVNAQQALKKSISKRLGFDL